ncbi:MAG: M56 family metallopeptidase [Lachnospiraceae bacterium]|nr:M56 family metallopeptidase [Lachnospiraceae bacterium]
MSVVMKSVFSLSLSGSLLILVLFFGKPLFKNRLSRQWQYYIWLVVIVRLLLPIAPETSIVGELFANMNQAGHSNIQTPAFPTIENDTTQIVPMEEGTVIRYQESVRNGGKTSVTEIPVKSMKKKLWQNLWIPWLVIAALLLIRKITLYQSFVKYVKAGHREVSDTDLLDRLAQVGEQAGVRRPMELYVNSLVPSPLLIGFFRPCIILQTADLTEEDFQYTIWHELVHYKRKDMFYKWLVQLTVCLHWFNPLVWLMGKEINHACEFSCDEAVIESLGEGERRAYGDTLFRAMGTGGGCKDFPVYVTLNESVELLKERLRVIMDFKKSSRLITTISIVFTVAMMMGATAMGAYVVPVRFVKMKADRVELGSTTSELTQTEGLNVGNTNVGNQSTANNKTGEKDLTEYWAEQYYEKDMVLQFGAVFSALDESVQRKWLDRVYASDDIGFFSDAVFQLDNDSPLIEEYLEKAYVDDKINYFSVLIGSIDSGSPLIGEYAKRAYADDEISFFSVLIDEMSAELLQSWQDKAQEGDMDISFQSILLDSDDLKPWLLEAEQEDAKQYQEWGITREGKNYYYLNQLVRVFSDQYDGEMVFRTLNWNPAGTVDVKVTRNIRNKIMSVEFMTAEEVTELFGSDDFSNWEFEEGEDSAHKEEIFENQKKKEEEIDPENDVYRLDVEDLPEDVRNQMMDHCEIRTWYVYHSEGQQYLCYKGFAWSYGYQLTYDEKGWQINIQRFQKKDYGDLLLALPDNGSITVYCDGQEVALTEIER